jgi:NTP pyrophosphatase (non-canonical NTP hydrolase)
VVNGKNHAILQQALLKFLKMTIQEAQSQVDGWIKTTGVRYFSELTNMAILTEEVGELARHMSRQFGEQSYKEGSVPPLQGVLEQNEEKERSWRRGLLADEMADVLWVLICLANQTGVNLTDALEKNFEKKNVRDGERHKKNEKLK